VSAATGDTACGVIAHVARRWQAVDPLLPVPEPPPPGCGARLIVAGADGQPTALGSCEHWVGAPGSMDLAWGAARRFQLTPQVAGPDVTDALDRLLSLWRDHLAGQPHTDEQDTAAVVTWPSRDIDGVAALLRHGFAPLAVVAARPAGCRLPGSAAADGSAATGPGDAADKGVRIRRAGPADIDAVVRLGLEVVRFDAHFSDTIERPETAEALRGEAAGLLGGSGPWTWLAERDGTAIGLLAAERPESAGWIAPMTQLAPVAYLVLMVVLPGERASGIGADLVARLHHDVEAAGVALTLLHYEQLNPLSAPFWSQQGYRPLWTTWEARPARAVR
jgi:GNAT superfamily N-acetyltransferase